MVNDISQTLTDLAVENAYRFLQTVVVIDNKAYLEPRPSSAGVGSMSQINTEHRESEEQLHSELVAPEGELAVASLDPEELNAKALADRFGHEGIACATFRPDDNDDVTLGTYKVAESADILILDWILSPNDNGEKALSLICRILDGEHHTSRLRLIAIYTGERDLRGVAEKTFAKLSDQCDVTPTLPSDFVVEIGHARVIIYGKENTPAPLEDTALAERFLSTADLPKRLVSDFAEMTQGILPGVAIAGLSEVRAQTHKLLTMFSTSLDSAYLGHRLLLDNPSEAEAQVVTMLVSELHSILEDGLVAEQAAMEAINIWINERDSEVALNITSLTQTPSGQAAAIDTVLEALKHGNRNIGDPRLRFDNWKWQEATQTFEPNEHLAMDSNLRFSEMMLIKTRYGNPPPTLTLGSILFRDTGDEDKYWLCLQPRCDSVRIDGPRTFPMLPLCSKDNAKQEFEIVVKHRNCWKLLQVLLVPHKLKMFEFDVHDSQSRRILATRCDDVWKIKRGQGRAFEWVAELKDEHAQRIVNEFASVFSRVGVSQSEWVRRSGRRRD